MVVLKIIFDKDHLKRIINAKCQLAKCKMATDSGWRNIADFKLHKMQILTNQNLNELYFPWFLGYRTKTFRNWKMDCNFVINRKKNFFGCQNLSCFLKCAIFDPKFYRDSASISQKTHAFFKSHLSLETFIFLLTKFEKNTLGHIK